MKRILSSALVLSITAAGPASAQGFSQDIGTSPYWNGFEFAGDTVQLSLEAARQRTVMNSLIKDPTDLTIDSAKADIDIAEAVFDPTFTVSTTRADTDQDVTNSTASTTRGLAETDSVSTSVSKLFSTGTTVSASKTYSFTNTTQSGTVFDTQSDVTALSLNQPLLKNSGRLVNELATETAKISVSSSELSQVSTLSGNYQSVTDAYWNHWFSFRSLEIAIDQYERAVEQQRLAQRLADGGLVANVEVLRAQTGVAQRIDSILLAQSSVIATNNVLAQLISEDPNPSDLILYRPMTSPDEAEPDINLQDVSQSALDNSLALQILENTADSARITLDAADKQRLPDLDLDVSYTTTETDLKTITAGKTTASDQAALSIGLTLTYPLFERDANADYRQARNSESDARIDIALQRQSINKSVETSINNLFQNYRRLQAASQEVDISERIYEAEVRQFNRGEQTSTEVLDAATRLSTAQTRLASARSEYEKSRTQIDILIGDVDVLVRQILQETSGETGGNLEN